MISTRDGYEWLDSLSLYQLILLVVILGLWLLLEAPAWSFVGVPLGMIYAIYRRRSA